MEALNDSWKHNVSFSIFAIHLWLLFLMDFINTKKGLIIAPPFFYKSWQ